MTWLINAKFKFNSIYFEMFIQAIASLDKFQEA